MQKMAQISRESMAIASTANSEGAVGRMANLRQFQPGQSGNPRGRPKRDHDVAQLARRHTVEAIQALVDVMRDEASPPSARVSAATVLLDRGYGRPPQSLDVQHKMSMEEEFDKFVRELQSGRHVASFSSSDAD